MTTPYPTPLPEAPLSINFKIPEVPGAPMLTIRASQGVELEHLTADVARHGAAVGKNLTEFRAGFLAGAGLPQEAPSAHSQAPAAPPAQYQPPVQQYAAPAAPQTAYQQPPAAPQTGGMGQAPSCPHGAREFKSGISQKTGRPYKMWVCPAPMGDPSQCKPEYVK